MLVDWKKIPRIRVELSFKKLFFFTNVPESPEGNNVLGRKQKTQATEILSQRVIHKTQTQA